MTDRFISVHFLFLLLTEKSAEMEMTDESTKVQTDFKLRFKYSPQIK